MSYSPPSRDQVDFELSAYTPPSRDQVDFDLGVQVPTAPQIVAAVALGDNITVDWDPVTWNGDVGHYDVYRSSTSGGPYAHVSQVASGTTEYTDTLPDGAEYFYVVDATNLAGTSPRSNEESAETTVFKVYDGAAFVKPSAIKYWDGTTWQTGPVYEWDGSSWVRTD